MKTIRNFLILLSLTMVHHTVVSAVTIDVGTLGQAQFESLSDDLSAAIWMNPGNSAEPHSAGIIPIGFQIGVESSFLTIDSQASHWAALGASIDTMVLPKIRASVGVPFGLDASIMYMKVPSSNIKVMGYEGRLAFGEYIPFPLLELNVRAYQSELSGVSDFNLKETGFSAMLGADFPIFKPYIELGSMTSTSTPSGAAAAFLNTYKMTTFTKTVGAKMSFIPFMIINAEMADINNKKLYTIKLAAEF